MRKIFTFITLFIAVVATAEERTVWEGSEQISWNTEAAPGSQFETPSNTFTGLAKGDTIKVSSKITDGCSDPQYVLTYKSGDDWTWTDLSSSVAEDGTITYVVESSDIATWITERNLIFRGQAYTITKIVVATPENEEGGGEAASIYNLLSLDMNSVWPKGGEEGVTTGTSFADGLLTMGTYSNDDTKWCGAGWWLAQWDGELQTNVPVDFSAYDKLVITFASATTTNGGVSLKYNTGDAAWVGFDAESTKVVIDMDASRKNEVMEVTIQGPQGAAYAISEAYFATNDVSTGITSHCSETIIDNHYYNLNGQQITKPAKGLYIKNGKKHIAK